MIQANGVFLEYKDGTKALEDINLTICGGDVMYIIGRSGSGKTSLLKLFMGMEHVTCGTLRVLGRELTKNNTKEVRILRTKIGPVFQEFKLIKGRTAIDNIMLGMRFLDFSPKQIRDNAKDALDRVGLIHKETSLVENLSWGEQQRIAIARAVARKPALIIADEPTGNLDTDNANKIFELLTSFQDKNTAIIITTHATHMLDKKNGEKIIKIEEGRIC